LVAFNSALANGICDFPDGPVRAHADFRAIAAANTFGRGADRQYVGRNQLDAATLDRFAVVEFDYDAALEQRLAANAFRSAGGHDEAILSNWVRFVQRVREIVAQQKVRHVVSPRASIMGARFIAAGGGTESAANALIWKGLSADQRAAITAAC
jgi:MoxR-like ATPase